MKRYLIKEAFALQSFKPSAKLMFPGQYYATENEAEIAELEKFAKDGSCKELVSIPKPELHTVKPLPQPKPAPTPTEDDLAVVPGVGKKLLTKLAEKGITTKSQLGAAIASKPEETKKLLGSSYDKIKASLSS